MLKSPHKQSPHIKLVKSSAAMLSKVPSHNRPSHAFRHSKCKISTLRVSSKLLLSKTRRSSPRQGHSSPLSSSVSSISSTPDLNNLIILGIETSCDDTGISIVNSQRQVLSNEMLSQLGLHQLHGGVVPTIAMRAHAITINYLVAKSLLTAGLISTSSTDPTTLPKHQIPLSSASASAPITSPRGPDLLYTPPPTARTPKHTYLANTQFNHLWLERELDKMDQFRSHTFLRGRTDSPTPQTAPDSTLSLDIDAIAFTLGPGLSGSLAVGVDTAKVLGRCFKLPIIPVNHIIAHTTVAQLQDPTLYYPYLGVVISGGHTQLNYVKDETCVTMIASTVDDAVGEAFDKVYRTMNMDTFDFQTVQSIIIKEQQRVKSTLRSIRSVWPDNFIDLLHQTDNELLSDAYEHIMKEIDHSTSIENQMDLLNINSESIEKYSLQFINAIQTTPDLHISRPVLNHVGCVNDLFNQKTTPEAIMQTFAEAQKLIKHNHQQHHTSSNLSSSSDSSLSPSTTPSHSISNPLQQSTTDITPYAEREILAQLSQSKTIPHGAQIELAASLYIDMANILHSYDFMIMKVLQQTTPLLQEHDQNNVYFAAEANRCFGLSRKAAQFTTLHRFLPLIPLPLPLHSPSAHQSYTGFSMAGLKTKIRQYCVTEMGLMQSVVDLQHGADQTLQQGRSQHNINPYNRSIIQAREQVPIYLSHLFSPFSSSSPTSPSSPITSISNIYRLTAASQFQTTTTQHFIQSISRSLAYLNHSIPGQDGLFLSIQPQSLSMLSHSTSATDPTMQIGHPSTISTTTTTTSPSPTAMWKKYTSSILPTDQLTNIIIGGGVACNQAITKNLQIHFDQFRFPSPPLPPTSSSSSSLASSSSSYVHMSPRFKVHAVTPRNCGDNGVMIAWSGLQKYATALSHKLHPFNAQFTTFSNDTRGYNSQHNSTQHIIADDPIMTHIIDAQMVHEQQQIMDREFIKLVNQTTTQQQRQQLSTPNGAESFSVLYQRPKWPLPEVFVNKPVKPVKVK